MLTPGHGKLESEAVYLSRGRRSFFPVFEFVKKEGTDAV